MSDDQITFAQLRACLQVAGEVLSAETPYEDIESRLRHACGVHSAEYSDELDAVAIMLTKFGKASRHD